jgi:hypothetical protein
VPAADEKKPSVWKERRDWITIVVGVIGLSVSIAAYLINRGSASSNKSLILVVEKAPDPDGAHGSAFVFHPLNQAQRILQLSIFFPSVVSTALQTATPLTQELNLYVEGIAIEHYESRRSPPPQGRLVTWDGNIPVILEAQYVSGDERLTHRGLYMLSTHIVWWGEEFRKTKPPKPPWEVSYGDVTFSKSIGEGADYDRALIEALYGEEEAHRKLFNSPSRP